MKDEAFILPPSAFILSKWQARRESNPQPPVLETGALPIELLAYTRYRPYLASLCTVRFRSNRQYFLISSRSGVVRLFFVVM